MSTQTDLRWCIQCTDKDTMTIGSFVYHRMAPMRAVSPVYQDLASLFTWMKEQGYTTGRCVDDLMVHDIRKGN